MNDRLLSALSLCRKAGRLKMGGDVAREEIYKGSARLVLLASDAAERTVRQMRFACEEGGVPLRMIPRTMDELWATAGKRYGVFAVCDSGFATMITGLLPPEEAGPAEK